MNYTCTSCGHSEPTPSGYSACSECGRKRRVLELGDPLTISVGTAPNPVGLILEGDPEDINGRRVHSSTATGTSESAIQSDGSFNAELAGALERGRKAEPRALKVLASKLRDEGHEVRVEKGARDAHGEDGILRIDGKRVVLQMITVPNDPDVWKRLHVAGAASIAGDRDTAVELLRAAILAKALKAKETVLVLDTSHVSAFVNNVLVEAYRAKYGDPRVEFGFEAVWIVAATARSTIPLA
jgi:hypothetical protein